MDEMEATDRHPSTLYLLAPHRFPDREAVREFINGPKFGAMIGAIDSALDGCSDASEAVQEKARGAAYFALMDVQSLTLALAAEEFPKLMRDSTFDDEWRIRQWAALMAGAAGSRLCSEGRTPLLNLHGEAVTECADRTLAEAGVRLA